MKSPFPIQGCDTPLHLQYSKRRLLFFSGRCSVDTTAMSLCDGATRFSVDPEESRLWLFLFVIKRRRIKALLAAMATKRYKSQQKRCFFYLIHPREYPQTKRAPHPVFFLNIELKNVTQEERKKEQANRPQALDSQPERKQRKNSQNARYSAQRASRHYPIKLYTSYDVPTIRTL